MDFADWSMANSRATGLARGRDRSDRATVVLATSFTTAAATAGLVEVLVDRIAAPAMAGALGATATAVTSSVAWLGRLSVSITAVLVLLALAAWAAGTWDRLPVFAVAVMAVVVFIFVSGLFSDRLIALIAQASVVLAVTATLVIGVRRASLPYTAALGAAALAIVAGQWGLSELSGGSTLAPRAIAEASLVAAVVLLAVAVSTATHRGLISVLGLTAGAGLAAISLASDFTPFVALLATGSMMWLPSLAYIAAAGAVGYVLATWLSEPTTRHRFAGLILLGVAGVEPALVHHSATALLAIVALSAHSANHGVMSWQ